MQLNYLPMWSLLTTLSAIVLFIQGVLLFRVLSLTRQSWKHYFLVLVPVSVSIWTFYIVQAISNVALPHGTHFNIAHYRLLAIHSTQAIHICQIQVSIILIIFLLMFFHEKKTFPEVHYPPTWVTSRLSQR